MERLNIYNEDGTLFHNLVLHNWSFDSVVMSLGDKITGEAYYQDNRLQPTMKEYVVYKQNPDDNDNDGVKFVLVNPPTIVKEGMVSDNSDLSGMTKYSFEFYHPMYILNNIPFSDIAVSPDETAYLSENKTFFWIGYLGDFIKKLNKNLQNTEWVVELNPNLPLDVTTKMSEVLSFDKNTIADALKTGYETWEVPYIVSKIKRNDTRYAEGKRFAITYGLPSEDVIDDTGEPFVFKYGQGVGLKNDSRTPKNNKVITRLAGYGSERNIPYGYPQIKWYGEKDKRFTFGDGVGIYENVEIEIKGKIETLKKIVSYPIYKGIYNGEYVPLIKHPYTRKTLMPSAYRQTLFNKISFLNEDGSLNANYDPDITLIDYIDADETYENPINYNNPSYESHEFETYPRLGEKSIEDAYPVNDSDLTKADGWNDNLKDNEDNYQQSYFKIKLPILDFNLYACAAITEEMQINMRSGACNGCTFTVQIDWEDYKRNFFDKDGNFDPTLADKEKYPDSRETQIEIVVQKDLQTFGTIMPNVWQVPKRGDEFVILGISLPSTYIINAENELDDEMTAFLRDNNKYHYEYPLKFDEHFLTCNKNILYQLTPNKLVRFQYAGKTMPPLYIKQLTIKHTKNPLPQYDITLTDDIEVVINKIGEVVNEVSKLDVLLDNLKRDVNVNDLPNLLSSVNGKKNSEIIKYLKQALAQDSEMAGGLLLTTLIALRDKEGKVWSGINGAYEEDGIAAWFGGTMDSVDSEAERPAMILFRFDGSGYLAGGNILWNKNGELWLKKETKWGDNVGFATINEQGEFVFTKKNIDGQEIKSIVLKTTNRGELSLTDDDSGEETTYTPSEIIRAKTTIAQFFETFWKFNVPVVGLRKKILRITTDTDLSDITAVGCEIVLCENKTGNINLTLPPHETKKDGDQLFIRLQNKNTSVKIKISDIDTTYNVKIHSHDTNSETDNITLPHNNLYNVMLFYNQTNKHWEATFL